MLDDRLLCRYAKALVPGSHRAENAFRPASGAAISRAALSISITLLPGHVIWGLPHATIDRRRPETGDRSQAELGGKSLPHRKIQTLRKLIKKTGQTM